MPKKKLLTYIVFVILIVGTVYFFLKFGSAIKKISIPFFVALIIAYLVDPLVIKLESKKIPKKIGILLIYFVFTVLMVGTVIFIVPEIINNSKELINTLPNLTARFRGMVDGFMKMIRTSKWPEDVKSTIFNEIQAGSLAVQDYAVNTLRKSLTIAVEMVSGLFDVVLAAIIAYYFIKDANFFRETALSITPRKWRNWIVGTGREINSILSNFIQGQLLTALIVGILESIGLLIVRVKYPLILGLIGGLANVIPYFGPFLGAIPAVTVALVESPMKAVWTALVFTIVQQLDNSFISPKIIEGKLGMHPVTTILAVLIGGEFFGIIGMLVSVPVAAIVKVVLKRAVEAIV